MADIHIERVHALGLPAARKVALQWAGQAEADFGMDCIYEQGKTGDEVRFTRSGVDGTLKVSRDRFEFKARLGFLLGAFKDRIESEITKNLDALLAARPAAKKAAAKKPAKRK
ncbi:MAG: polyhydroxyalkanoic acid system family protein [Rhodoferax sp.]